ncbi:MAG: GvpL/GvpF family gas vesicle protein [Bacteroidota bacterium]|jgi:Gas vesicle synthesis protein GvpL/GvpF
MGKMIYSIIKASEEPTQITEVLSGLRGISGANLEFVQCADIIAVTCSAERKEVVADRSNTLDYAGVIDELSKTCTLLPVRFGSVMESEDDILKMLERNYQGIQNNLDKVEGKVEFGLKVFCDTEKLKSRPEIFGEENIKIFDKPPGRQNNSVYLDYVNKKLIEYRIEEALLLFVNSVIKEITDCCISVGANGKFRKMVNQNNIIDALFLVERSKTNGLIGVVKELQVKYPDLDFILTGPWPPYNFVDITIS